MLEKIFQFCQSLVVRKKLTNYGKFVFFHKKREFFGEPVLVVGGGDITEVISPVGHLRDHPQHDHVVQSVGCAQQVLHRLQLVVGALVEVLT